MNPLTPTGKARDAADERLDATPRRDAEPDRASEEQRPDVAALPWTKGLPTIEQVAAHEAAHPAGYPRAGKVARFGYWLCADTERPGALGPNMRSLRVAEPGERIHTTGAPTGTECTERCVVTSIGFEQWMPLATTKWAASCRWLLCTAEGVPVDLLAALRESEARAERAGYERDSVGWDWIGDVFGADRARGRMLWSRYATALYERIVRRAERGGWLEKLRYLLYEDQIAKADAPTFSGLRGVLLQSKARADGFSVNPHIAALQKSPEHGRARSAA